MVLARPGERTCMTLTICLSAGTLSLRDSVRLCEPCVAGEYVPERRKLVVGMGEEPDPGHSGRVRDDEVIGGGADKRSGGFGNTSATLAGAKHREQYGSSLAPLPES